MKLRKRIRILEESSRSGSDRTRDDELSGVKSGSLSLDEGKKELETKASRQLEGDRWSTYRKVRDYPTPLDIKADSNLQFATSLIVLANAAAADLALGFITLRGRATANLRRLDDPHPETQDSCIAISDELDWWMESRSGR